MTPHPDVRRGLRKAPEFDLHHVASKWTAYLKNAQTEIEELVGHTEVHITCYGSSLTLPTEAEVRFGAGSGRSLERGEIRATE